MEATRRRRIFRDIVRGYTTTILEDDFVYIKHLTPHDQVELEEIEEKYYKSAQRRGVPTEKEMLDYLKEEGQWTEEDEKIIAEFLVGSIDDSGYIRRDLIDLVDDLAFTQNVFTTEEKIEKILGLKVNILNKKNNSGKIIVEYKDIEQFELISDLLTKR